MDSIFSKTQTTLFKTLLGHLFDIEPIKDYSDEIWRFHAPAPGSKSKWLYHSFTKYQGVVYWVLNCDVQFEFDLKKNEFRSEPSSFHSYNAHYEIEGVIKSCIDIFKKVKKDWLGHHQKFLRDFPKKYRFGLVQRRILWDLLPDMYRPDQKLTGKEYDLLMEIFRNQERSTSELAIESISLKTYLEYCRIAYLANLKEYKSSIDKNKSGLEMYKAMADNRHEGLLDIAPDSPEALTKWYHGGRGGGHPWEICRGGNTTHINLGVYKENDRWFIFLQGNSTGRMLETSRMALALYKKKMPFRWFDFNDVRLKMLGRDNIGFIPEYDSLHRAWQLFDKNYLVFDCLHLRDLEKAKTRALKFITWLPIEALYPRLQRRS